MFLQSLHQGSYSRGLLTNGYIDAIDRLTSLKETLLINNSIDCDGGLTSLAVDRSHQVPCGQGASRMSLSGQYHLCHRWPDPEG